MKRVATGLYIVVLVGALLLAAFFFFRARSFARKHAEAITQVVRMEAEKSDIIAEAKRVDKIETPERARGVVKAGARVSAKVAARIEAVSEAVGTATVEGARADSTGQTVQGTIGAADEHKRFLVTIPYTCSQGCEIETGEARWAITQRFQLEAFEFEQTGMEDGVAFKGFSVTLTERSPVDDSELHRYVSKRDDITATYTIRKKRGRLFAPFANVGLEYLPNTGDVVPYGLVGVRVKRLGVWVGAFGSTPAVGVGVAFGG